MADASEALSGGDQASDGAPVSVSRRSAKRWPLVFAVITSWICPATTARRLAHVGLLKALAFHIVSGGVFCIAAVLLVSLIGEVPLDQIWKEVRGELSRDLKGFLLTLAIGVGVVEACAIGIALLVTPWGARDEKLRTSFYHSLRVVWLQSAHVTLAALLHITYILCWFRIAFELFTDMNTRPWYSRHGGEIFMFVACLLYGWAVWALLRAVGARPAKAPTNTPPTCQVCGYNLTATASDGVCPECGEPVSASVGRDARAGIEWERRGWLRMRRSWWQTAWSAIRHPGRFSRDLQIYSPPADHRRFLFISMILTGLVGVVGATFWLIGYVAGPGPYASVYSSIWDDWIWVMAPMSALWAGVSVLGGSLLFAGVVGLAFSVAMGRNVLAAAMRCSAYLSGCFVLWAAINLPVAWLYGYDRDIVKPLSNWLKLGDEEVALAIWGGFNLIWLCVYIRLLQVSISSARFANR